jgi:CHAT domain-containing protein
VSLRYTKYLPLILVTLISLTGFIDTDYGKAKIQTEPVKRIYSDLENCLVNGRYKTSRVLADSLEKILNEKHGISSNDLAASLYYIGLSYSLNNMVLKSFPYFEKAVAALENDSTNQLLGKIYYNLGYSYNNIDDDIRSDYYFSKSIRYTIIKNGENSKDLVQDYISLAISSIKIRNYEKAIEYCNNALNIARIKPDSVDRSSLALIYQNKGVALSGISDYSQGMHNLNRAWEIYNEKPHKLNDYYINCVNNLAATYFNLGNGDKCFEIYEKDLKEISNYKSFEAFGLIRNYSTMLAKKGQRHRGDRLFENAVGKVRENYPESPNKYYDALSSYAEFLRDNKIDPVKALQLYSKCFDYVKSHPWNENLNNNITLGYSLALLDNNKPLVALDTVCSILYRGTAHKITADKLKNPELSELKADRKTLEVLQAKYQILDRLAAQGTDTTLLLYRARTAELLIELLETIRLNIGEEQSRIILGGKYRNAYIDAIRSYKACFDVTGKTEYLEKAFGFSERSKAATLLASMREINAMKAAIPREKMDEERELQKEKDFYESKVEEEKNSEHTDTSRLNLWEKSLLSAIDRKTLLTKSFEKKYPDYSSIRTSRIVLNPEDVRKLVGRNKDYLSYLVSDTGLYIFLVNRNETRLVTVKTDTSFLDLVTNFRRLLSEPYLNGSAQKEFKLFQEYGYRLYSFLIKPVAGHLATNELIISTDNLLSCFPFETIVTSNRISDDLYYSRLPYLMNDFRISYVYSATLLSESGRTKPSTSNSSVTFAPSYQKPIMIDSLSVNRQQTAGLLPDLRFAREEAEYVARLTSGKLYLDSSATKTNYLAEAGKFDIIHLAMHTVLNSRNPVNSGMIFYDSNTGDGKFLQPYEVYSVILKAKMVVLSSCYTGAGTLYAGEGVLSLARGFIFSGSHSVVMSLWEINDRSGTEIMKDFYRRIKSGKSKSEALREARINYLKGADMLRAHPYFWATLVVYGDDSAIYIPSYLWIAVLSVVLLIVSAVLFYFRKR